MDFLRRLLAAIFPTTTVGQTDGWRIVTWKYTPHFLILLAVAVAAYYFIYGEMP